MAGLLTGLVGAAARGAGLHGRDRYEWDREQMETMRQEAVARAREMRNNLMQQARDQQQHGFRMEEIGQADTLGRQRDREEFERQSGLLESSYIGEDGRVIGMTRSGEAIETGITGRRSTSSADDSGMPAGEARIWDRIVEMYTSEPDDFTGEPQVDWTAVAKKFREEGYSNLASLAEQEIQEGGGIDVGSQEYLEAKRMADEWIAGKTTVLGRDKTELAEFGGNREEARARKTLEFYRELTGQNQPEGRSESRPSSVDTANMPKGAGTEADPYQPTSDAEYEAMPVGAVFVDPDDGKRYRKQ